MEVSDRNDNGDGGDDAGGDVLMAMIIMTVRGSSSITYHHRE